MDWKDDEPRNDADNGYDNRYDNEMTPEKKMKTVMVCLCVVVAVLAGVLAYIWWQKSSLIDDLNMEKEELTAQMIDLQNVNISEEILRLVAPSVLKKNKMIKKLMHYIIKYKN